MFRTLDVENKGCYRVENTTVRYSNENLKELVSKTANRITHHVASPSACRQSPSSAVVCQDGAAFDDPSGTERKETYDINLKFCLS